MKTFTRTRPVASPLHAAAGVVLLLLVATLPGRASTLLSYWDFNNTATSFSGSTFGTFSTTNGGFGEVYNAATKQLSANTAYGVYTTSSIDFSSMNGTANSGTTGTTGWGVFNDSSANLGTGQTSNLVTGDASTQHGSLIMIPSGAQINTDSLVFNLDTQGYQGISLSMAARYGGTTSAPTLAWAYSLNGGTSWITVTPTTTGTLSTPGFYDLSAAFGSVLDNAASVELKLSITQIVSSESIELDNVQVLAALAVPEPSVVCLLGGGALALLLVQVRNRRNKAASHA